jgi:hypothetical protein
MRFHSGNAVIALSLLVAAPGAHAKDEGGAATKAKVHATAHTASDMTSLYYDDNNTQSCGKLNGITMPAYFCSGIIIRAAAPGPGYNSWNPSPEDEQVGGVSFSYIRKDSKFGSFVAGKSSGFTLYPVAGPYVYRGSQRKNVLKVECAFPLDGWTDDRGAPIGCGKPKNEPDGGAAGQMCQQQGITTAQQWMAHFQASTYSNPKLYQCGFDMSLTTNAQPAAAFMQMIAAMKLLGNTAFEDHNELRIAVWDKSWNKQLPIQSFFYVGEQNSQGWTNARTDQKAYYAQTGEFVPVIKIKPPADSTEDFSFHFYADDQAVQPPPQ